MKKTQFLIIIALALVAGTCSAQQRKLNRELNRLPPAVRQAIRAKVGDARFVSIDKDAEDGDVTYDVEMARDGKSRGFTVDDTGALVDEEVFLEELPPAVQSAIQQHSRGATLDEIDKSIDDSEVSYDVEIVRAGVTRDFTVDGDGELLEEQVLASELPAAVRQTLFKEAAGGTLGEIDQSVDEGETLYDADVTKAGQARQITVDAKGTMIDNEVFLAELPAALQAAIRQQGAADGEIHESFDDGEVSYDVDAGGNRTLSFDPDGTLFSTEEDVLLDSTPDPVREQIKTLAAGGKILGITRTVEDNETSYDVDTDTGGVEKTFSLGPDGKVLPDDQ